MFFDVFYELCKQKGVSPNKACINIGVSRTAVAKWKSGGTPNGTTLAAMAEYFGVTTDYLLTGKEGEDDFSTTDHGLTFDDFTQAMHGASGKLSEKDKKILLDMANQLAAAKGLRDKHEDSK